MNFDGNYAKHKTQINFYQRVARKNCFELSRSSLEAETEAARPICIFMTHPNESNLPFKSYSIIAGDVLYECRSRSVLANNERERELR